MIKFVTSPLSQNDRREITNEKLLLLGRWCLENPLENFSQTPLVELLPHHWISTEKYRRDLLYLLELSDRVLNHLAEFQNSAHGVSLSLRSWKIVLGPWLNMFLLVAFDRWEIMRRAREKYPDGEIFPAGNSNLSPPTDYASAQANYIS